MVRNTSLPAFDSVSHPLLSSVLLIARTFAIGGKRKSLAGLLVLLNLPVLGVDIVSRLLTLSSIINHADLSL